VLSVGDLEPAELGADLPCPLAAILIVVVSDVLKLAAIVALKVSHAHLVSNLHNDDHPLRDRSRWEAREDIANRLALTILDLARENVSKVVHEVTVIKAIGDLEEVLHISCFISREATVKSHVHVGDDLLNHGLANGAAPSRRVVDIKVVVLEVSDGMNDARGRPGSSSRSVLGLEPGGESTRVASANGKPLADAGSILGVDLSGLVLDEEVKVGEGLGRVEILEVL
jgi:hypothetical protein